MPGSKSNRRATVRTPYGNRKDLVAFLSNVYSECFKWKWKSNRRKKVFIRSNYRDMGIEPRATAGVYRAMIDRECPEADLRQKSRWVRALQYADREYVDPLGFVAFLKRSGGISGCAAEVARKSPKRKTGRVIDSWIDLPTTQRRY